MSFGGVTQGLEKVIGTFMLPGNEINSLYNKVPVFEKMPKLKGLSYTAPVELQSRYKTIETLYLLAPK